MKEYTACSWEAHFSGFCNERGSPPVDLHKRDPGLWGRPLHHVLLQARRTRALGYIPRLPPEDRRTPRRRTCRALVAADCTPSRCLPPSRTEAPWKQGFDSFVTSIFYPRTENSAQYPSHRRCSVKSFKPMNALQKPLLSIGLPPRGNDSQQARLPTRVREKGAYLKIRKSAILGRCHVVGIAVGVLEGTAARSLTRGLASGQGIQLPLSCSWWRRTHFILTHLFWTLRVTNHQSHVIQLSLHPRKTTWEWRLKSAFGNYSAEVGRRGGRSPGVPGPGACGLRHRRTRAF